MCHQWAQCQAAREASLTPREACSAALTVDKGRLRCPDEWWLMTAKTADDPRAREGVKTPLPRCAFYLDSGNRHAHRVVNLRRPAGQPHDSVLRLVFPRRAREHSTVRPETAASSHTRNSPTRRPLLPVF